VWTLFPLSTRFTKTTFIRAQTVRNMLCLIVFVLCAGPIQAQANATLFDGKTTSGWIIEGDAEVKDGLLVLGGNQKTRVRIAANFSPDFELQLEYSTENNKHIQIEAHHRHLLGHGSHSMNLGRKSKKPGEWIEAVVSGKEDPAGNGWVTNSKWRVVGDAAFTNQPLGGAGSVPSSAFVAFEIPAGQKLYLRNVRVKTDPAASALWLLIFPAAALVVVLIVVVSAWAIMKKRRTPTQSGVHGPVVPKQSGTS
jgi:hypothetical protein